MKNKTVIWNFYPIDELNCAKSIGFDLFPGCEIRTDYYDKSKIDKNNCNIVLVDYFFHPKTFHHESILRYLEIIYLFH